MRWKKCKEHLPTIKKDLFLFKADTREFEVWEALVTWEECVKFCQDHFDSGYWMYVEELNIPGYSSIGESYE